MGSARSVSARKGNEMETITLNNGVEMPALGLGVFQTPPDETRDAVARRARLRLPPHRHRRRLRQRAPGRRGGAQLRPGPVGGLPGDQDLDQRLRIRRDAARLREERPQARRRPDRPADPAPGAAVGVRPDPGGLPRPGDAARRRQGPRHRGQQLHGRAPHDAARPRHGGAGGQPDRGPPVLRAAGGPGVRRRARHPHAGVVTDRRHHLLPRRRPRQHPRRPGHRRHRRQPTARPPPR